MKIFNKKAFSILEFTVLFIIIIGAFLLMRNYIQRGIFGQWGKAGQGFAYGRQFDKQRSIECSYDEESNAWYDHNCAESQCPNGDPACVEGVIAGGSCDASSCAQLNQ